MEPKRPSFFLNALLALARTSTVIISVVMIHVAHAPFVFRYVIAAPLPWSEEMARYCFVWIVFLGGAVGLSRGVHLGVDLFVNMLPAPLQRVIGILTSGLIAAFAATVINASLPVLNMNMFQRSPALGVQMTRIYIAIPVSMALIFLICVERILKDLFQGAAWKG